MRSSPLGRLETLVMDCLWRGAEAMSVRDVAVRLNGPWAYTTLMTTLDRLFKKNLLNREPRGRAFVYRPRVSRAELGVRVLATAVSDIGAGSPDGDLAIAALVDAIESHDPRWLDSLDRMVRERKRALREAKRAEDRR
jgi:predicted transcriptional regulator